MLRKLGQLIGRHPLACIAAWVVIAALATVARPDPVGLSRNEPASLLPEDSAYNKAMRLHAEAFPDQYSRSRVVAVYHRGSGLTVADRAFLRNVSTELEQAGRADGGDWRVTSSALKPFLKNRLESVDGQAVMVVVDLPVNFVTQRAMQAADLFEQVVRRDLPQGLTCEVTGSAAIGREYGLRSQAALKRTSWVTVLAVLVILMIVYRSPLGAIVPLLSIGCSVYVSFCVLDLLAARGWSISSVERTFTIVLLFGAGTDYALFWISRYREELSRGRPRLDSAVDAMIHVGPVILASAGTTILGLMMLMSADLVVIKNAGKVLGIVLSICLLAAMTLTPAMAYVMGDAFFWPGKPAAARTVGQRSIWPRVASDLVHRPTIVFLVGLIVIGIPAVSSFGIKLRYDSFGEVAKGTTAARGLDIVENHFSRDELFSSKILIESDDLASGTAKAKAVSSAIAERLSRIDDVTDVWHVGAPFGSRRSTGLATSLGLAISQSRVRDYYFAADKNILQLEVMQSHPPLGAQAAGVLAEVRAVVESWAHENLAKGYSIHAIGDTPYIESIKAAADRDLRVVVVWVVVVIFLTVLFFIRRFWLSVFMLIATLITYSAALGLTEWVFVGILGRPGVDYKIKIFVFVVIVAVGQDYNVFLVMRMLQELKSYSLNEAVTRAVVLTGPVISSCGLIMAAALGSLSTSGMDMTEQLGFAFAAGILLYTFVVRPLLIPSFYLIMERMRERGSSPASASPPRTGSAPSE